MKMIESSDENVSSPEVIWRRSSKRILNSRFTIPRDNSTYKCEHCGTLIEKNDVEIGKARVIFPNTEDRKKSKAKRPISLHLDHISQQKRMTLQSQHSNYYMDNRPAVRRNSVHVTENIYEEVEESGMSTLDIKIKVTDEIIKESNSEFCLVEKCGPALVPDNCEDQSLIMDYQSNKGSQRQSPMCLFHNFLKKKIKSNFNIFCINKK